MAKKPEAGRQPEAPVTSNDSVSCIFTPNSLPVIVDSPEWCSFISNIDNVLRPLIDNFQGGRLSSHLHAWKDLTSDRDVLSIVKGLRMEFFRSPFQSFEPNEYKLTSDELNFVRNELDKLLKKQVIEKVHDEVGQFLSNIFLVDKKDGSYRMILNLSRLNDSIDLLSFIILRWSL